MTNTFENDRVAYKCSSLIIENEKEQQLVSDSDSPSIEVFGVYQTPAAIEQSISAIRNGFRAGLQPCLSEEGTSGSYVLKTTTSGSMEDEEQLQSVAVWKPIDEEPFAPNNPRGMQAPFGSDTCRPGVKSGESSLREVLAFLLDHDGFAGVPPTALVEVSHPSL